MKAQQQRLFLTVMIFMASLSAPLFAQGPQDAQYSQDQGGGDPPGRVARLGYISGSVSFQPSGEDQWSQALANYPLTTGDRIYTDRDGRAELETGNIAVRLSSGTDLAATNLNDQLVQLGLAQGTLRVRAYQILDGSSVEIDTPNAALTLLRAGSYRVETFPDDNTTLVTVDSGDLEISGNNLSQVVHSGQSVKLSGNDEVQVSWLQPPGGDDFDRWCGDRDRRFTSSNSRQYVGPYVPGYEDLDQYGQWQPAQDYGQVWYPSAVPVGWAPYRYGRWAWVEPWGWTWVEDEPWGFAPFHYGRWALIGARWGWVPGSIVVGVRPVYAPALVAFVGGPNANVQVWFPLGPRDPFLPWYHHSDGYLRQVNVTNVRTEVNIVNVINVRNVNNIHYAYQGVAPTAVSTEAFRGSRPVAREAVHVDVNLIGRAQVIPHPEIHPDANAIHAGAPASHPPVERTRPKIESRAPVVNGNGAGRPQGNPRGGHPQQPQVNSRPQGNAPEGQQEHTLPAQVQRTPPPGGAPTNDVNRNAPPNNPPRDNIHAAPGDNRDANRGNAPAESTRPAEVQRVPQPGQNSPANSEGARNPAPGGQNPPADNNRGRGQAGGPPQNANGQPQNAGGQQTGAQQNGPPQNQRPLVTKAPPPQQNPSFSQRQGALQEHPGRPLEPQQVDNIRRGQPAGDQHDHEVPAHNAAPAPQQQPKPKAPSPPPKAEEHGKDKDKPKN
jgi:hypothetical protein